MNVSEIVHRVTDNISQKRSNLKLEEAAKARMLVLEKIGKAQKIQDFM